MKFSYRAYDKSGREVAETIEAADPAEATQVLRGRGLFVTDVTGAAPAGGHRAGRRRSRRGQRLKDLAVFARQLYVLVRSGAPLVDALGALARQVKPGPWRDTITDVRKVVEEGAPLAEAMAAHGDYFDSVACSLITAGEAGGNLAPMLDRLARLTQKRIQVRNSIMGALTYPCLLVVVAMGVLGLLLVFVIPRFAELFKSLDVPLPASTKVIIVLSNGLRTCWWALAGFIVAAAAGLKLYLASPAGRRLATRDQAGIPQASEIPSTTSSCRCVSACSRISASS